MSNSYLIKTISFDPLPLLLLYTVCVAVLSAVTALHGVCSGLYVSGFDPLPLLLLYTVCVAIFT